LGARPSCCWNRLTSGERVVALLKTRLDDVRRRRAILSYADSLLAPVLAHIGTNSVALLVAVSILRSAYGLSP